MIDHITANPNILGGKPIIRGTRLSVEFILDLLASDVSEEEILEDVLAFIEFEVTSDKIVHLSPDQISRIEESRKQIKSGKSLTQKEVEQHMKEWLKK